MLGDPARCPGAKQPSPTSDLGAVVLGCASQGMADHFVVGWVESVGLTPLQKQDCSVVETAGNRGLRNGHHTEQVSLVSATPRAPKEGSPLVTHVNLLPASRRPLDRSGRMTPGRLSLGEPSSL